MAPYLLSRSGSTNASAVLPISRTVYIVGFTLAGLLVAVSLMLLALKFFRHKLQAKRAEERGAAFLNVRGVVREMNEPVSQFLSQSTTVVFPQKVVVPRPAQIARPSRHDHVSSSEVLAACAAPLPRPRALSNLNPSHPRHSRSSSISSGYSRLSPQLPPGLRPSHSRESSRSSASPKARSVRQFFQPVLADELPLSRVGEQLHVLQSFDDGWCLVVQNNSRRSRASLSIFNPSRLSTRVESSADNVQVGFVPAWVFIKPVKGLRVERPIRSSSAGLLQAGVDAAELRDSVISWSNFS
ncbi:hypothetical protein EV702DRAFT_1091061 [Suillus placidus]|uniref:SH3 domain-containing protein n=1 Tax=Suillus placidus TaxID=48579 RepID=A0A9P7D3T5_9AGAM|nr:hypothetical protein EV702DRAFT_1091061 [Suillus placidus]